MTRGILPEIITALDTDGVELFLAVELLFDDNDGTLWNNSAYVGERAVRLWTGHSTKLIDGETYYGAGGLLGISDLPESSDLSAKGVSIQLSGAVSELVSVALQEPYQNRKGRILFGASNIETYVETPYAVNGLNPDLVLDFVEQVYLVDNNNVIDPSDYFIELFSGFINVMPMEDGGDDSVIEVSLESKQVMLQKPNIRRYTKENHQSRHSGDTFFDFTSSLEDKEIGWGRKIS